MNLLLWLLAGFWELHQSLFPLFLTSFIHLWCFCFCCVDKNSLCMSSRNILV
jgi:hypothetical protein